MTVLTVMLGACQGDSEVSLGSSDRVKVPEFKTLDDALGGAGDYRLSMSDSSHVRLMT